MSSAYDTKVDNFLKKENIKYGQTYKGNKPLFEGESDSRDIYEITLNKNGKRTSFQFGNSLYASKKGEKPKKADTLYVLKSDYDAYNSVTDARDFAETFGYEDQRQANKIYKKLEVNANKYDKMFNQQEKQKLDKIFEDY